MSTELPAGPAKEELNPFAPPRASIDEAPVALEPADLGEAEAIRREYIGQEAAVKSIGALHYLGAFIGLLFGLGMLGYGLLGVTTGDSSGTKIAIMVGGAIYLALGGLQLALGIGLSGLRNWARWTDVALISLSLLFSYAASFLAMPVNSRSYAGTLVGLITGSLIPGYILYLLVSSKANTVFSPEYKAIVARTPHVKRRTSLAVKILLAVLVAVLGMIAVSAVFGR